MRTKGINSEQTKKSNRLLVLRLLCTMRETTRTEITKRVGLNKMTVSNITSDLLTSGTIYEKETVESGHPGAGRRQMLLGLSQDTPAAVGLWLSRDFCLGIAAAMDLQVLERRQVEFSPSETAQSITDKAAGVARELMQACGRRIAGVGVASIGPLDKLGGMLLNPPNFYQIQRYPIVEQLEERLGCPVFLQNDANAGALAEMYYGCCQNVKNFAYVGITNGIGAGLVIKESLFDGTGGFAGEIGHMVIDCNGPECYCGNRGCLETFLSVPKILERFTQEFRRSFQDLREVCDFCEQNAQGEQVLRELLGKLSIALSNLCNLVDPERIVMGHAGAELSDAQLEWIGEQVNARVLARGSTEIQVARSGFGTLAPVYGAAVTVLKQIFDGNLLYTELFAERGL